MIKQMKVNPNISYETLAGLIGRATDDEKLMTADDWLRGNKVISIQQHQRLRSLWENMVKKHGTHCIIISWGRVKHKYVSGLTYKEALQMCENDHWEANPNNGCIWDMEIDWDPGWSVE